MMKLGQSDGKDVLFVFTTDFVVFLSPTGVF